jgi:serine/threonine-protein kinase SRPK3
MPTPLSWLQSKLRRLGPSRKVLNVFQGLKLTQERPRSLPADGFPLLELEEPVQEEIVPGYRPEYFYPVKLGQVFHDRYQVLTKLGYGAWSTIWLARDLK